MSMQSFASKYVLINPYTGSCSMCHEQCHVNSEVHARFLMKLEKYFCILFQRWLKNEDFIEDNKLYIKIIFVQF